MQTADWLYTLGEKHLVLTKTSLCIVFEMNTQYIVQLEGFYFNCHGIETYCYDKMLYN